MYLRKKKITSAEYIKASETLFITYYLIDCETFTMGRRCDEYYRKCVLYKVYRVY